MKATQRSKDLAKLPKSKLYNHVTATIDSGPTIAKQRIINPKDIIKRRDEQFYRVTRGQLSELLIEYEDNNVEEILSKPFLLYDVRDVVDFKTCKIQGAQSYPATHVRRDYTPPELYDFKNKEECLVILYCDGNNHAITQSYYIWCFNVSTIFVCLDERISSDVANTLVYRGTDNIFLLTGGLRAFAERFPEFVEGYYPRPASTPVRGLPPISETGKFSASRGSVGDGSHRLTESNLLHHGSSSRTATGTTGGRSGLASVSNYSTTSVAASVISRSTARKNKF